MPISNVLKNFRDGGYGKNSSESEDKESSSSRMLQLSEEEVKSLEPYQVKPGEEIILEVSGKLEDDHFHVMNVKYADGGGMDDMAAKVAGQEPPMMMNRVLPSPS